MNVYSDTLSHDAVLVWLAPPGRDVVGGIQMRTAPPPDIADTITVTELVRVQAGVTPVVEDSLTATETVTVALPMAVVGMDANTATEAVEGRLTPLLAAVSDDPAPVDAVTLALLLSGVSVADALTPGETVELRAGLVVHDDLTPTDVAAAALPAAPVVADLVGPTDAVALALNVLTLAVTDAAGPVDVVSLLAPIAIEVDDETVVEERRVATIVKAKKVRIRGRGAGA